MSYPMPPLSEALFSSMHNKLIHFPIVLTLVAAVASWLARRRSDWEPLAFWLIWTAALSALAAFFSGSFAELEYEKDPKHWLAETHGKWSIAVGFAQAAWLIVAVRPDTRRFTWAFALLVVALVSVTAFLGGLVAHGK